MKKFLVTVALIAAGGSVFAQPQMRLDDVARKHGIDPDKITRTYKLDSVEITSTRATATTPVVFSTIKQREISQNNHGQDMPFLLQFTPSVVVTSDAGAGVGYTGIRIRGTDATRINVTVNGVPMNDAESHGLFWVNTPDIASSMADIQIQRGVGTSTNGAGAFGGSINMRTESIAAQPFGEIMASYGSYNTHKQTLKFGTGLLGGRWAFDARLSNIHSDGYRDRASTDLKSYFAQGAYYAKNTVLRFVTYGGKEETYHAWDAIDASQMKADRRYNPCGEIYRVVRDSEGKPVYEQATNLDGTPTVDGDGNPVMKLKTELHGYYDDQTDNYVQSNYQVQLFQSLGERWTLNATLHYTKGDGYYEEYKGARTLEEYGLKPFAVADPSMEPYAKKGKVVKSDLVRRKMMDNWFAGGVFSVDYKSDRLQAALGGAFNVYDGDHFGRVIWVQNYAGDPSFDPAHRYYNNNGRKEDLNLYLKANWQVTNGLFLYGDLQYRHIDYTIEGRNDNWDWTANDYAGEMQRLDINDKFDFLNPKAGIMWHISPAFNAYASVAIAHREPTRNNYTDATIIDGKYISPKAERLTDWEAGATYRSRRVTAGVNLYYMKYKDQLILNGKVNHIGEPLADNVPDSYRMGVELSAGWQIASWLRWDVHATLSRNRIENYTEYVDDMDKTGEYTYTQTDNPIGDTDISFSPSVIAGSNIIMNYGKFNLSLQTSYVGDQYVTNSEQKELKLDDYCVSNLTVGCVLPLPSMRSLALSLAVNNIFNAKYCSNGYGWSNMVVDGSSKSRLNSMYYFPQATTNVMANVVLRF